MADSAHPRVLVVLVNWRRVADTLACIESLQHVTTPGIVVAVCENGSGDGSDIELRTQLSAQWRAIPSSFSEPEARVTSFIDERDATRVVLVESRRNLGFAGGNNLAQRLASAAMRFDHVWYLNNDTEVEPDCLALMLDRMREDPRIGICGATLVYAHDRRTVQCLGGCTVNIPMGLTHEVGNQLQWPCEVDERSVERRLDYVSGASMLVTARFLAEVGPMTEDYFIFYEEIDWAERARRAGYRLGYAKRAVVYHKEGATIGTGTGATRSALAEFYGMRNKMLFTWRFHPWAFPTVWMLGWAQVLRRLIHRRFDRAALLARTLFGSTSTMMPRAPAPARPGTDGP